MMDAFDLASRLFGNSRAESRGDVSSSLDILTATGAGDSSDGAATVYLDADVTPADDYDGDDYAIGIPTSPNVIEGDGVLVGLTGSGALKTPVVISNPGSGDRMQVQISNAETLAEQAEAVATATGQHFWSDTDGAHVTEAARENWETTHTGANSLWNSLGMLFRDGLNNLLAVLTSGIAIYDGNGNAASNILAEFMADHVRVGGNVPNDETAGAAVQFFDQTNTHQTSLDAVLSVSDDASGYDMTSDVTLSSTLADEGLAVDTGSSGTASVKLDQWLSYGITDPNEQFSEVHAALVADAAYDEDSEYGTSGHAAIRATASTGSSYLTGSGYAEAIADYIGLGPNESNITYFPIGLVKSAIPIPLYDNPSASASASATLSETAANFSRLTIFYKDNDGNYSSADVWQPDGKRVALAVTWISGASTQEMYQRVRWVTISGARISTYKGSGDAKYRTGQVKLGAAASVTNADYISIVHVIGYR